MSYCRDLRHQLLLVYRSGRQCCTAWLPFSLDRQQMAVPVFVLLEFGQHLVIYTSSAFQYNFKPNQKNANMLMP